MTRMVIFKILLLLWVVVGSNSAMSSGGFIAGKLNEHLSLGMKQEVDYWIKFFVRDNPGMMETFLEKGSQYEAIVTKILESKGLPAELFYVALIESGYRLKATSYASASGMWQFVKPTGRIMGLRIDSHVDERWDPIRSTIAATEYLSYLKGRFRSWFLALAAYNAGETRLANAIERAGTRNFWLLSKRGFLPLETREYVPKFIAAATIARKPSKYGISVDALMDYSPAMVLVPSRFPLNIISNESGIGIELLMKFNPHLKRRKTPPGNKPYYIWLPKRKVQSFNNKVSEGDTVYLKKRALAYQISDSDKLVQAEENFYANSPVSDAYEVSVMPGDRISKLQMFRERLKELGYKETDENKLKMFRDRLGKKSL